MPAYLILISILEVALFPEFIAHQHITPAHLHITQAHRHTPAHRHITSLVCHIQAKVIHLLIIQSTTHIPVRHLILESVLLVQEEEQPPMRVVEREVDLEHGPMEVQAVIIQSTTHIPVRHLIPESVLLVQEEEQPPMWVVEPEVDLEHGRMEVQAEHTREPSMWQYQK